MISMTRPRHERGQSLVEMALALPILLLVIGGIVDFGLLFQRYEVITNAAREGARIAVLPGYTDDSVVASRVAAYVQEGLDDADAAPTTAVTRNVAVGGGVNAVRVEVSLPYDYIILGPIMGLFGGGGDGWTTITLTARSTMRCEFADCT